MRKIIEYPKELPPMTPEEKKEARRIIAEARSAGHPLAQYAGTLMDDPTFNDWIKDIRDYRQSVEDDPGAFGR